MTAARAGTVANRRTAKHESLAEASGRLDALGIALRLSKRLGFLSNGGYAELSAVADEIGRMLDGWMKYDRGGVADAPLPEAPAPPRRRRSGGVRFKMTSPSVERYLRLKLVARKALPVRIIDERPVGTVSRAVGRMAEGIARVRRKRRRAP